MQNILVLYSETLEIFLLTEPNRIKHDFAGSGLFQYFDVFSSSVQSKRTRNIEKVRFSSVRFVSVRHSRKFLEFHC